MSKPIPVLPIAAGAGLAFVGWRYLMPGRRNEAPTSGRENAATELEDARDYRDAFGDFGGMAADPSDFVAGLGYSGRFAQAPASNAPPLSTPALASVSAPPSSYRAPSGAARTTTTAARAETPETPADRLAGLWDALAARFRGGS